MHKIIIALLFTALALPLCVNAQSISKEVTNSNEIKNNQNVTSGLQELKSKLVDEYGVDGFRFIKSNEMKDIKNYKTLGAKELSKTSGLDEYTIIIILAAIGAIAVILFIFK